MSLEGKFLSHVKKKNGCWKWLSTKNCFGYGRLFSDNKEYKAHRVSWELKFGPIPNGLFVLHKCDNPECTNPDHLFLGTQRENMNDCLNKGRHSNAAKTHCKHGHEFNKKNSYFYKNRNSRLCKICKNKSRRKRIK